MKYDLGERTRKFSKSIILMMGNLAINPMNQNIISQLLRSGTSVGANYCEANNASSKRDFRNKIHICLKEVEETTYWIEMLAAVELNRKQQLRPLWYEAHELTKIFSSIAKRLRT